MMCRADENRSQVLQTLFLDILNSGRNAGSLRVYRVQAPPGQSCIVKPSASRGLGPAQTCQYWMDVVRGDPDGAILSGVAHGTS
jgi:hypothetical protein